MAGPTLQLYNPRRQELYSYTTLEVNSCTTLEVDNFTYVQHYCPTDGEVNGWQACTTVQL